MKFLNNIFKRNCQIERVEALSKIFRYSREEDIAKVFELGRIEALTTLKRQLFYFLGTVGAIASLSIYFFLPSLIDLKIDSKIDSKVEREIDKRIDRFSNFVHPYFGIPFYWGMMPLKF